MTVFKDRDFIKAGCYFGTILQLQKNGERRFFESLFG
jgi:hypothetical protein